MRITYSCKIECDSAIHEKLIKLLEAERLCFNECSVIQLGGKNSIKDLHAKAYRVLRTKHPTIPSQVVIRGELSCLSAYRSIKSNKHKVEKPPVKRRLAMQLDKRLYSEKNQVFRITTLAGRVSVRLKSFPKFQELWDKYPHGDPKLFVKNSVLYLAFSFIIPEEEPKNNRAVGIDLGIRRCAATSEGLLFIDKQYNKEKRRLRYLKRCLQSKQTNSARRHLKKLQHTERNKSLNFCHNLSKKLLQTKASVVVLEDLSQIKNKKKRGIPKYKKINRLSQAPFFLLRSLLTYKALLFGKRVITVSPFETSQIDHKTNSRSGKRQGCRFYTTRKGLVYDADVNAAINIALRSKHPVSFSRELDGQAIVNTPIVGVSKTLTSSGL